MDEDVKKLKTIVSTTIVVPWIALDWYNSADNMSFFFFRKTLYCITLKHVSDVHKTPLHPLQHNLGRHSPKKS